MGDREDLVAVRKGGTTRRGKLVLGVGICAFAYKILKLSKPIVAGAFAYVLWWALSTPDDAADYAFVDKEEAARIVAEDVGEYQVPERKRGKKKLK